MPQGLDFFLDPCSVISHNRACRLNNTHTGLKGYGLEMTWCHINNCKELSNAHSSLVDCKAQTDVVLHQDFVPFIDKHSSIVPMNEVWSTKRKNEINHKDEVTRPVPNGWTEDDSTTWKPGRKRTYTGPQGGGEIGPSHLIKSAIGQSNELNPIVNLFLFLWTEDQLQTIAKMSEKYARGDWVKASARHDEAGNERQRAILVHCSSNDPDHRHRHPDEKSWKEITVGYILAFLSILMLRGAYNIRSATLFWESPPSGIYAPFVQNLMPRNNFLQIRRYLHFVDSESLPKCPKEQGWHPLQKIKHVLENVQRRMQLLGRLVKTSSLMSR
jgi:hypothetical protein